MYVKEETKVGDRRTPCSVTRLANGEVSSVDVCECGTMQVNLGAFMLRLSPETVAEIARTLNGALVMYERMRVERERARELEREHEPMRPHLVTVEDMEA
ncbi:MAG: hypothetical protein AAGI01_08215 [Myxococcota bacterium]